jgi:hypothetical protein
MLNDKGQKVYRKLFYFFDNNICIHFKVTSEDINGIRKTEWKNGRIIDLDERKLIMVLQEFVEGEKPFLLEDININSIVKYTTKVGEK